MIATPAERRAHATNQITEMARLVLAQVEAGPEVRQPTDAATASRFEAIERCMAGAPRGRDGYAPQPGVTAVTIWQRILAELRAIGDRLTAPFEVDP